MVEKNSRLTKEEARALIADLSEEEKKMLAKMLERMRNGQETDKK